MSIPLEMKARPVRSGGWRVWDKTVEGLALVVSIFLSPIIIIWRAFGKMGQYRRFARLGDEYEVHQYRVELAARRPVNLLQTHLEQLREMEQCYLTTQWASLQEAKAGYKLMEAARLTLMAEAQAEIRRTLYR